MAAISTIIMAGGLGTRMRSPQPKVLRELCGILAPQSCRRERPRV